MRTVTQKINYLILFLAICAIVFSFYAQYILNQEPCPLCIVQRLTVVVIFVLGLFSLYQVRLLQIFVSLVLLIISVFGAWVGYHHYWLTTLPPDQLPMSCGMPMAYLFKTMNFGSFLSKILSGDAECAVVNWKIFGLSAPLATCGLMLLFAALSIVNLLINLRKRS